ncbi:class B sortase [Bariatricus sp. HCP28S3_A7]|uniref:class B sortase n=1 Tax=Bariatricus sp. HCP28S3_A7 TaxID=3438894 RepID=UPI003F8C143D
MKEKGRKILIILLLAVAVGCAGYLIWHYISASKTEESYEEARKEAEIEIPETEPDQEGEAVQVPIDFEVLQKTNPDVYAWIRIDGTKIDYPIVQKNDDDNYYLNHTWEGKSAAEGAIFTQACNSKSFLDFNTLIYGHQMGEGVETMFHQLGSYLDADFMKDHREIVIYTPDHIRTYKVFAAVVYDDKHIMQYYNFVMNSERQAFLDSIYNSRDMRNQYCDDVEVSIEDRIITLSTCISAESDHRLLVEAVLTDEK